MFELIIIICRYLFVIYILYFLANGVMYVLVERGLYKADRRIIITNQKLAILLMHITAFLILSWDAKTSWVNYSTILIGAGGLAFLICGHFAISIIYKKSCPLMWNGVFFLMDTGLFTLQRLNKPLLAGKQLSWLFVGFVIMLIIPLVLKIIPKFEKLEMIYLILGFLLLCSTFVIGTEKYGAKNWVSYYGISFQPSEIVKFLFIFYLASVFRKKLNWKQLIFPAGAAAAFILVLVSQKDLGGALIYFMTFMVMLYISTGSEILFVAGFSAASFASVLAYQYFPHIRTRVEAWQNPIKDIAGGGYQIMHSLFAIGTWGVFGSGLTRGFPLYIPVVESDFIFSAICEEMGIIFGIGLIGVILMVLYRGVHIALRCKRQYYALLSAGFTSMLAFQTFLILGGDIKLIPLTGVTLPFVSYGGSSVVVCTLMVGILEWIYMNSDKQSLEE